MSPIQLRSAIALAFCAALCTWGVTMLQGQQPAPPTTHPSAEQARLAEAQIAVAQRALAHLDQLMVAGFPNDQQQALRATWNRRLLDARLAAATDTATKIKAAEEYVSQSRVAVDLAKAVYAGGGGTFLDVSAAEWTSLEAESILENLKASGRS